MILDLSSTHEPVATALLWALIASQLYGCLFWGVIYFRNRKKSKKEIKRIMDEAKETKIKSQLEYKAIIDQGEKTRREIRSINQL